jgi:hypothetical protein
VVDFSLTYKPTSQESVDIALTGSDPNGYFNPVKIAKHAEELHERMAHSTAPIDEFRRIFKEHNGEQLRKILSGALQFDRISNASAEMREISARAKEALVLIGRESPINARRVAKNGLAIAAAFI